MVNAFLKIGHVSEKEKQYVPTMRFTAAAPITGMNDVMCSLAQLTLVVSKELTQYF